VNILEDVLLEESIEQEVGIGEIGEGNGSDKGGTKLEEEDVGELELSANDGF
jgi:hypothetical protein